MGQITPNISIYVPAAGETNYDAAFLQGMVNIDQHDHSGGPNKGVPLTSASIANGAITYPLLNANVADPSTGIGVNGALPNQLVMLGILKSIYLNQTTSPTNGLLVVNGATAVARTLTVGSGLQITRADGIAGNPLIELDNNNPDISKVVIQTFLANGTYTPTVGMEYCTVEVVGGGGGGGSVDAPGSDNGNAGGGGGGGGYARKTFSAVTIGVSQAVTIGAGGAGAVAGGSTGTGGGTTSLGALISATGGSGGVGSNPGGANSSNIGGAAGIGAGGDFNTNGSPGLSGWSINLVAQQGTGGASFFGGNAAAIVNITNGTSTAGANALSYGAGGNGAAVSRQPNAAGGNGFAGIIIITEFVT